MIEPPIMHPVARTQNGCMVLVNLVGSDAAAQIAQQPHLLTLVAALLKGNKVDGEELWIKGDMGHAIGNSDVIETKPEDAVYYAQRQKSESFVRLVKNRKLQPTSVISIKLVKRTPATYELKQIVLGHPFPNVPQKDIEDSRSQNYWANHAFLAGDWPIKTSTITKDCPWA